MAEGGAEDDQGEIGQADKVRESDKLTTDREQYSADLELLRAARDAAMTEAEVLDGRYLDRMISGLGDAHPIVFEETPPTDALKFTRFSGARTRQERKGQYLPLVGQPIWIEGMVDDLMGEGKVIFGFRVHAYSGDEHYVRQIDSRQLEEMLSGRWRYATIAEHGDRWPSEEIPFHVMRTFRRPS